jgi:hypothetical protein
LIVEIKKLNDEYEGLLETDEILMFELNEILRSPEYFDYKSFLSQTFFSWSEDFYTLKLYEMGTAS